MVASSMVMGVVALNVIGLVILTLLNAKFTRTAIADIFKEMGELRLREHYATKDREVRQANLNKDLIDRIMAADYATYRQGTVPLAPSPDPEPDEDTWEPVGPGISIDNLY